MVALHSDLKKENEKGKINVEEVAGIFFECLALMRIKREKNVDLR